jgi:hypothetical protein
LSIEELAPVPEVPPLPEVPLPEPDEEFAREAVVEVVLADVGEVVPGFSVDEVVDDVEGLLGADVDDDEGVVPESGVAVQQDPV